MIKMLTLLKNAVIGPCSQKEKKDILIAGDKICKISPAGALSNEKIADLIISCDGLFAYPGIIDQHVHIAGGGGEQGFESRTAEISINDILMAGVTAVVGLLGADGYTRCLENLLAKAKALETQGITTFIYSGSYALPAVTLTGSMTKDLVLIDKVIGAGEIAISDHRSSQPDAKSLFRLASQVHLGGLLGSKAGVVHIHVGDGKNGLRPVFELVEQTDLPIDEFVPTHVNRNPMLFKQAINYCGGGGNIDLTAGETNGIPVADAVEKLIATGMDLSKVTISSDANGSIPGGGVSKISALYDDVKTCITKKKLNPETVFRLVTENAAKILRLYPKKGAVKEGSDADILLVDSGYNVQKVIVMGKLMVNDGRVVSL